MKKQLKDLYLKSFVVMIKAIVIFPVIVFLIYEALITENEEALYTHTIYVAIITTLCWVLIFWAFTIYKMKQYVFSSLVLAAFLYMFFCNTDIQRAHWLDTCLDRGNVWDYDGHICREDCLTWNEIQKCIPLQ